MKQEQAFVTCVGLNHLTSPVEEREKLAFGPAELPPALAAVSATAGGAVLLSTCNRTELYAAVQPGHDLVDLLNGIKGTQIDPAHFYVLQHREAVRHLFRVASGIDSMVLGESQILGQVRDAMSAATAAGTLNGVLSRVFHSALAAGKRARTETDIGRHAVSISSAAVALARESLGDLAGKTVLVISAGSMGKLAAKSLAQQPGARVLVANRTRERALAVAGEIGANTEAVPFSQLGDALAGSDIVISGTSAEGFIIGPAEVRPLMAARNGRGLLFIDIAVPRDIDPAVREIRDVHLFDIDDIEAVAGEGWRERRAEVSRVEMIVEEEVNAFLEWWRSLDVYPVIAALRGRAEAIRRHELERTLRRLPEMDEGSRLRIEAMTAAIVKKMLDRPIARLKDGADKGLYMEALQDLFDVHPGEARSSSAAHGPSPEPPAPHIVTPATPHDHGAREGGVGGA
ncbi:MAG: glutamyl-tRNA reductase [Dehalococcoidia bacterium]|nr:glutamyl-tRNA reductase [Dehalococcoidia bacterium]